MGRKGDAGRHGGYGCVQVLRPGFYLRYLLAGSG